DPEDPSVRGAGDRGAAGGGGGGESGVREVGGGRDALGGRGGGRRGRRRWGGRGGGGGGRRCYRRMTRRQLRHRRRRRGELLRDRLDLRERNVERNAEVTLVDDDRRRLDVAPHAEQRRARIVRQHVLRVVDERLQRGAARLVARDVGVERDRPRALVDAQKGDDRGHARERLGRVGKFLRELISHVRRQRVGQRRNGTFLRSTREVMDRI